MPEINLLAVLIAALTGFLIGGLWYSPLMFLKPWLAAVGSMEKQDAHPARVYGVAFVFMLIAAAVLAWWLGPKPGLAQAVGQSALVGAAFVATSFGVNYQFANRSATLWLIDGGYHVTQFAAFGLVLGIWP